MSEPPPLGGYDDSGGPDELCDVELLNVPVRVLVAGREHHDELMREFALLALGGATNGRNVPARLLALTQTLGVRYGGAASRPDELIDAALARGEDTIELSYRVPAHICEAASTLDQLLQEADDFCRAEQLLTLERSPVVIAFGQWYCEEFQRQVAGQPPRPWKGPLEP
ncbi:MAG: hypothetical protein NVS3B26_07380 [Mycobacteriales bacterium]